MELISLGKTKGLLDYRLEKTKQDLETAKINYFCTLFRRGKEVKKVVIAMLVMFLAIVWPLGGLWGMVFAKMIGGGVSESFLYPIYGGIILLTGLIVGCTIIICEKIESLAKEIENSNSVRGRDQEL